MQIRTLRKISRPSDPKTWCNRGMSSDAHRAPTPSSPHAGEAEAELLADALGIDRTHLTLRSREPLGSGSVAGFDVETDGAPPQRYFVDTSGTRVASETGLVLTEGDDVAARIWLHPADPHLPALAPAAFGHAAASLVARLGRQVGGVPSLVGYRPGRRAVLRAPTDTGAVWIKVVRPSRVRRIVETHTTLQAAGLPLPAMLGWSPEGLIVLASATGVPATDVEWRPARLLDAVDDLRRRLAAVRFEHPVRGVGGRLDWYAERLTGHPEINPARALALISRARAGLEAGPSSPEAPTGVHGDLHYGQLFLSGEDQISGLIDVDTAGYGDPDEDAAAFRSHAIASALLTPAGPGRERVWALARLAGDRWGAPHVNALVLVHLLGHTLAALDRDDVPMSVSLLDAADAI